MKGFDAFLVKNFPEANRTDGSVMFGYNTAMTMVHVLKSAGNNLTRENIMKQAASIKNLELPGLLPGIKINTSATDFAPIKQLQLQKFKGERWELFGPIISGEVGG
jgi:branched-chain amino acid transport system substrate-binding protein